MSVPCDLSRYYLPHSVCIIFLRYDFVPRKGRADDCNDILLVRQVDGGEEVALW